MERRKIADEEDARRALAAVARSGEGLGTWARANGIDGRSLHAWEMNLARGTIAPEARRKRKAVDLIELVPRSMTQPQARYAIRLGNASLEFGDDAREETLMRLVAVLRSC